MRYAAIILLFCSACVAQTISPVTAEYGKKAKGQFSVTNDQVSTLNVTFMARDMNHDTQLSPTTDAKVKLSEYSARIAPQQKRTIYYDVTCATLPCSVVIFTHMVTGHNNTGVQIVSGLGHVVYICEKEKNCRQSFLKK